MNKKLIVKNVISSLITQAIKMVYGLIVPVLIIKKFGSNVNGLISSITQFLAYIALLEAGIGPVIKNVLFKPLVEKKKNELENIIGTVDKFFKKIAYIFIIYLIIICIVYPNFVSDNFSFEFTLSLIIIISVSNFFEYFIAIKYRVFLQADQKNFVIDNIDSISYILNLIIIIALIYLDCNIQIVKIISALVYLLKPLLLKKYFDKNYKLKINKKSDYKLEKKWDGLSHHIAATIQTNADVIILTIFSTLSNVSIYSIYALIINSLRTIIISFTNGIDSFFGKMMVTDENINNKFERYAFIFYTLTTILLSCAIILIKTFIVIYTKDITDVNYVQPLFAYILIFAEFNYVIRYPYSSIVYAKGHFKETRNFSIIEPIINLGISILLVKKYGLVGVAIGTFISMLIRSFGFIIYGIKNILGTKIIKNLKIIILSYLEMIIFFIINMLIKNISINNYFEWIIFAIVVFICVSIITILINSLMFHKGIKPFLKKIIKKVKK